MSGRHKIWNYQNSDYNQDKLISKISKFLDFLDSAASVPEFRELVEPKIKKKTSPNRRFRTDRTDNINFNFCHFQKMSKNSKIINKI